MPIKSNNDKNKPLNCVDGQPKSGESMIDGLNRDGKGKKAGKSDDHVATSDASGRDFHRKGSTQHSRQAHGSDPCHIAAAGFVSYPNSTRPGLLSIFGSLIVSTKIFSVGSCNARGSSLTHDQRWVSYESVWYILTCLPPA